MNSTDPANSSGFVPFEDCRCEAPPFRHTDFIGSSIGIDERKGRYAEVRVDQCRRCGRQWLHYSVEYEALPRSARWYRGMLSRAEAKDVNPENAGSMLEKMDWYFYGGSYFATSGRRGSGTLHVDL